MELKQSHARLIAGCLLSSCAKVVEKTVAWDPWAKVVEKTVAWGPTEQEVVDHLVV